MTHTPTPPAAPARRGLGLFKVLGALAIGAGGYAAFQQAPALLRQLAPALIRQVDPALIEKLDPALIDKLDALAPVDPTARPRKRAPLEHERDEQPVKQSDLELNAGYDAARANGAASHADCANTYRGAMKAGCQRYVTEQKRLPPHVRQGDWGGGKSTADCRIEVDAYWSAVTADDKERDDLRAAGTSTRRGWMQELRECQNYDNARAGKLLQQSDARLDALLDKLAAGAGVTPEERAGLRDDMRLAETVPEGPQKHAYFSKVDRFHQRADGLTQRPAEAPPRLSCPQIEARLDQLASDEASDVAAQAVMTQGEHGGGGAQWNTINKARLARFRESKRYTDAATEAGCDPGLKMASPKRR